MKNFCVIFAVIFITTIALQDSGYAQPKILVENIPATTPDEVKSYIPDLCSDNPVKRVKAAAALANLGEKAKDAVPYLIGMLDDTQFVLQQSGINIKATNSPAVQATSALISIGNPAVEPLITALKNENTDVRKYAAEALGYIKDARAVKPLMAARSDRKTVVRDNAYRALMRIIEGLKERQEEEPLIGMLKYEESSFQKAVIEALGSIPKTRVAENLVPLLGDKDSDIRKDTTEALKKIGKASVEPLIKGLKSDDIKIRTIATMILGDIKDTISVEPLVETLKYKSQAPSIESYILRLEAAKALGKIRDARAVEPLVASLNDENFNVRNSSAEALTAIGEKSVEPLIKVLNDDKLGSQILTAKILGDIKDPRAVEPLIQSLLLAAADNRSWNFRFEATRALGKIKDPRAVEALEIMLGDRVSLVHEMAEWSLNEIDGNNAAIQKRKGSFWDSIF